MKAVFLVPGPDGGIYEYREVPTPEPDANQILIRVRATGTNRGELLARPLFRSSNPALKPMPAGIEFAGEITTIGNEVIGWPRRTSDGAGSRLLRRVPARNSAPVDAHSVGLIPVGGCFHPQRLRDRA